MKHSVPGRGWGLRYQTKLLSSYMLIVLVCVTLWSLLLFRQASASLLEQANVSFENAFETLINGLNRKMTGIETAMAFVTNDTSFIRTVSQRYSSNYAKYYDVSTRLDPAVNTLRILHPEITAVQLYVSNDLKNVRGMFLDIEEADRLAEYGDISASENPVWTYAGDSVFVAMRMPDIYPPYRFLLIRAEISAPLLFGGGFLEELDYYGFEITDGDGKAVYRAGFDGGAHVARNGALVYPDWTLSMRMDQRQARFPFQDSFGAAALMVLVTAAALSFVAYRFSRSFGKRISALNAFCSQAPVNRFREDISSDSGDEIGEITNSVGRMVRETRTLIRETYESRIKQREAEIKALQAQINPHFLYNTLSAINWLSIRKDETDISRIVTALSAFYRNTLNKGNFVTSVGEEITTTKAYLDIQLYIHDNAFDAVYELEDGLADYHMPSLILQPIVENAIEHGIDMKDDGERGLVRISMRTDRDDILFTVADNGPGLSEAQVEGIFKEKDKGYGVKNVNDRLTLFFDSGYGLRIGCNKPHGVAVDIRVPKYMELAPTVSAE